MITTLNSNKKTVYVSDPSNPQRIIGSDGTLQTVPTVVCTVSVDSIQDTIDQYAAQKEQTLASAATQQSVIDALNSFLSTYTQN